MCGILFGVQADGRITIVVGENETEVTVSDEFPLQVLAGFLGEEVTIRGIEFYDADNRLVGYVATGFLHGKQEQQAGKLPGESPAVRAQMAAHLRSVMGQWPGEATDEEEWAAARKREAK